MNKFKRYILSLLLVLSVILIWQITENIINTNRLANNETGLEAFIPSPITIVHAYIESGDLILNQSAYTFSRAMVCFCINAVTTKYNIANFIWREFVSSSWISACYCFSFWTRVFFLNNIYFCFDVLFSDPYHLRHGFQ